MPEVPAPRPSDASPAPARVAPVGVSEAKRRILERLKRQGSCTAGDLARSFSLTDTAVRQHLDALAATGLVERENGTPAGRGRPASVWRLTPLAEELFPDRHADLTLELVASIRDALGEDGLQQVVAARTARQRAAYHAVLPPPGRASVKVRVRRLAELRTSEGYMAEALPDEDGGMLLVEHHCPICDAATVCGGLCASELQVFQGVLGDDVEVTRVEHLLSGDRTCAYRVRPRP